MKSTLFISKIQIINSSLNLLFNFTVCYNKTFVRNIWNARINDALLNKLIQLWFHFPELI